MKSWLVIVAIVLSQPAWAQLDPLLGPDPSSSPGLDSSRYTTRPLPRKLESKNPVPQTPTINRVEPIQPETQTTLAPPPQPLGPPAPPPSQTISAATTLPQVAPAPTPAATPVQHTDKESVQDKLLGGSHDTLERYRISLSPDDDRQNMIEFSVAPVYYYNSSSSNYWYRNYNDNGPAIDLGANVWISPFFGFDASYMTSLEGTLSDDPADGSAKAEVSHQWFNVGLRFRQFFGMSRKSPSVTFGLDFTQYDLQVPSSDIERVNLETVGATLSVEGKMPVSDFYSWTLGFDFMPRPEHREIATGVAVNSGSSPIADQVGATFGGVFHFSRQNQMFWNISESLERDNFTGSANPVDPRTGVAPSGVSVTNAFTIFKIGYQWGN